MRAFRLGWALGVLAGAAFLAGCSSFPTASSAVAANRAQEEAANKLLLLNVARAHERMPMHFSLMSQIRSGPGGWALGIPGLGLQIPFGGAAKPDFSLSTSLDGQTPVDVTPLTSQEFMRGMTEPMKAEMLGFFVRQGWSPSMLMYLAFEAIEIVKGKDILKRFVNDPRDPTFHKFANFVSSTTKCDVVTGKEPSSPEFYSTPFATLSPAEASKAKNAGLTVIAVDAKGDVVDDETKATQLRLGTVSWDAVLRLKNKPAGGNPTGAKCDPLTQFGLTPSMDKLSEAVTFRSSTAASRAQATLSPKVPNTVRAPADRIAEPDLEAVFVMRSPQSMIYFLGELSRYQNQVIDGVRNPLITYTEDGGVTGQRSLFFRMSDRDDIADPAVAVDYADRTFSVAKFHTDPTEHLTDRSTSVLSLMMLIVGLQDKGLTAPAVSNVRLLR